MLSGMDLRDLAERIAGLPDPEGFMARMVSELEIAELVQPRTAAREAAWEALDPDLRERYRRWLFGPPDAERAAVKLRLEARIRWINGPSPEAATRRQRHARDFQTRRLQAQQDHDRQTRQLRDELARAGLPYIPELADLYALRRARRHGPGGSAAPAGD